MKRAEEAVRQAEAEVKRGDDAIAAEQKLYDDRVADLEVFFFFFIIRIDGREVHDLERERERETREGRLFL